MTKPYDLRRVSNVAEWWKGFNAPVLKRRCLTEYF